LAETLSIPTRSDLHSTTIDTEIKDDSTITMPPVASIPGGQHGPSTVDKLKMGAMMGGTVGCIMGFIYGTFNVFRYGAGSQGVMRTIGQYMGASGATFGYGAFLPSISRSHERGLTELNQLLHGRGQRGAVGRRPQDARDVYASTATTADDEGERVMEKVDVFLDRLVEERFKEPETSAVLTIFRVQYRPTTVRSCVI
jgi:hypothetical protein